jgi:hypothetical protein
MLNTGQFLSRARSREERRDGGRREKGKGQAFGFVTSAGNIDLQNAQTSKNLEIDASLAAISQGGCGSLINNRSAIKPLTIAGGRIQNTISNLNPTTRNIYFDRRFASNILAPPWFPSILWLPPLPPL